MPDPEQDPPETAAPVQRLYSADEFGGVIRRLYPSLANATPDNNKLTSAILRVHPELRDHVIDPEGGMGGAPKPPALPEYGTGMRPPSPIGNEADTTPMQRRASAKGGPGMVDTTVGEARAGARRQDESYAGQYLAAPVTGATRAVKGAEPLLQAAQGAWLRSLAHGTQDEQRINAKYPPVPGQELAQGGADVIGGAMEAAIPVMPGALITAPLEVGAGLVAGTLAATGVEKAGAALNAPPSYVHLASEIAGLAAGIGGGHLAETGRAGAIKANDQFRAVLGGSERPPIPLGGDAAANEVADNFMLDDAKATAESRSDDQSLSNVIQFKDRQFQDGEIDKLSLGLAENYRLSQIAKRIKAGEGAAHSSPFDALDAFTEQPPAALPPAPEPAGLLGPGSPAGILAGASDQAYPGPDTTFDPNAVDVVDPSMVDQRPVATSEAPPPPLIQTLGEQLSSEMENQPPAALQPRPAAATRVKMEERQEFTSRSREVIGDAVSEMEDMPHQRGGSFTDEGGQTYTPPIAGSDWYWRIVGKDAENPPTRAVITELMRAYKDSGGKLKGSELPQSVVDALQKAVDLKTEGGARRAYDRWAADIDKQVRNRTKAVLGYERVAKQRAAEDAAAVAAAEAERNGAAPPADAGPVPFETTAYRGETPGNTGGRWFTPNKDRAADFGETTQHQIRFENPLRVQNWMEGKDKLGLPRSTSMQDLLRAARDAGHDGVVFESHNGNQEIVDLSRRAERSQEAEETPPGSDSQGVMHPDELPDDQGVAGPPSPVEDQVTEAPPAAVGDKPPAKLPDRALSPGEIEGQDSLDLFQQALHGVEDDGDLAPTKGNGEGPALSPEETAAPGNEDTLAEDERYMQSAKDLAERNSRSLADFFEKMGGEEGHLVLNIKPGNKRGLKDWLERHADEYGNEDWHQKATAALADGDHDVAWRIAAIASARSFAAAGARGAVDREHQPSTVSPGEIKDFREGARYGRQIDALKKELGVKTLPEGIDLNEEGQMTFGPPEKNLKAAATDLLLGRNFAGNVIDMADPRKIIRIEGNKDPELRINRQMAEQLVKSMPDEIVDPLMELLKISDRAEFAKHFARTVSSWGKGLRMLKDWQDDHWNDIVHIANPRPEGIGMGAAHLDEIRSTGGFVDWLKDASAQDREDVGFGYPKNIKEGTEEATKFAKSWFKQREARAARRITLAKTIGELAEEGSTLDKALIAGALEPAGGKSRGTLDAVENTSRAFVISQPVTLIRNMWTQAGRYSVGVLDDALAAGYSMITMDPKGATKYFDRAVETAKAVASPGNASTKMLKTPWLDSLETTYDYLADSVVGLPAEDIRKTIRLLDEFPRRSATYSGGLSLENSGDARPSSKIPGVNALIQPEVRNFVTVLGRTQEMAFRGAVFDSSVRAALTAEGLDPSVELAGDPTKLIGKLGEKKMDQIIGGAVASALDYTFAAKPYPGSIPALVLNTFSNIPVFSAMLRMGMPFPRFNFVSAPRWIYDHSPAALMDIPLGIIGQFTHENAPLKGRLYRGLEAQKIQDKVIPHLASEIGKTEYTIADKTQEFVRLKVEAQQAAKSFRELEKKAASGGMLPEIHDEIMAAGQEMQEKIAAGQQAKQEHADAVTQLRELKKQQKTVEEKLLKIKEIGAPTTAEYFARQASGAAMLTAAYLMRSSDGAKDTKWYEYNMEAPGFGKHTVDLRAFAPMVQYLLPADVIHSVYKDTDWKQVHEYLGKHPMDWEGALTAHYHGKYTGSNLAAEAATAFLSISPASGATAGLIDYITGRSGTVKQGIVQTAFSAVLSTVGQFVGRFTTPIRPLKDIAGQFDPEEAKARIPEESSDTSHHAEEVYGPALANIPYASEVIPEKKSPLTGEPIATVNPMARALAGLTERDRNRIEEEIAHTGIEYSKMVPRQTGDREFDNAVAEAYHQGLVKYAGKLLDHPQYQGMSPEIRRDVIGSAFGGLKQYALAEAGKKLGLDAKGTYEKTESPAAKQKLERWKGYLQELRQETERDHPTPVEDKPQASNAPPSGVGVGFQPQPFGQHVDRGLEQGGDARPPAGL